MYSVKEANEGVTRSATTVTRSSTTKSRVFDVVDLEGAAKADVEGKQGGSGSKRCAKRGDLVYKGKRLCVNLEENPKWNLLRDVLEEIRATRGEVAAAGEREGVSSVRVCAANGCVSSVCVWAADG